jgi:S-adenosylmethionine-diacylglycerol 3-amino-3-carboxypropyl transferase
MPMNQQAPPPASAASEIASEADFSLIRYAQCWEDTDVLLEALAIEPGDVCFSIGSGGDNSLSMLSRDPARVVAVDLSPAQVAVIQLKVGAFRSLEHADVLELAGITKSTRRLQLYRQARSSLSPFARSFWDARPEVIEHGLSDAGKFEGYFALFRRYVLPLVHSPKQIDALFIARSAEERRRFYEERWNNWRWRALFRLFFSRFVMGRLGRDPRFFRYVEGGVASRVLARTRHALVDLDPSSNPYIHWIVFGRFTDHLPHVWREENFAAIRRNLDRLELRVESVEAFLERAQDRSIDRFNMSDIFEYISEAASDAVFENIARCARPGARVAYWNMMAPRSRPPHLASRLHTLEEESRRLHDRALTFFYGAFRIDEARASP